MSAKQLINVNATGGAFVTVSASTFSNYVEIQEDGTGAAQGLQVQFPSDNFATTYGYPPSAQPVKLGIAEVTGAAGRAPLKGKPSRTVPVPIDGGGYTNATEAATIYCKVRSMGTATVIRVDERP